MEKRLLAFLWVSVAVVIGFTMIQRAILGPQLGRPARVAADAEQEGQPQDAVAPPLAETIARDEADLPDEVATELESEMAAGAPPFAPWRRTMLGSLDPDSDFNMLVTLTSEGGAVERIELNSPRYRELESQGAYLGNLGLTDDPAGGCRVQVVGSGTPAALATSEEFPDVGLRGPSFDDAGRLEAHPGDLITTFDGEKVRDADDFARRLTRTRHGQEIVLGVERTDEQGETSRGTFRTLLVPEPLQLVRPEANSPANSFLLSFFELGDRKVPFGEQEIAKLPSLRSGNWTVRELAALDENIGPGIEFGFSLGPEELERTGLTGAWDVVKRFRLARQHDNGELSLASGFRLIMEMEIINRGPDAQRVAYQLDGASGITDEGWWYSYKVHPRRFAAAGARDVIWRAVGDRHELFLCPEITQYAKKNPKTPDKSMIDALDAPVPLKYVGNDAQYFIVAMMPDPATVAEDPFYAAEPYTFQEARAHVIGSPDPRLPRRTNVTFRLVSESKDVAPGDSIRQRFTVFAGPKDPHVLTPLGLEDAIVYGWFKFVARPMVSLLHGLYRFSGSLSFGVAIVLLTVLVRGAMFPFGRKMAMNAQKMQELAPEMKRIAEKHADDLQKRGEAQRDLFRRHNYNPFGGCVVLIFQLPVFVGLYRALSVDIELRQAPLIPGLSWCSNLAGPDMFLHWESFLPEFLSSRSGWLGPFMNILPILSIILMLIHQKMFTPPPQDEQQRSQQMIMKYMMIFFGVMFHKIAAGLCIYFIASSLWGLSERLMLPKKKEPTAAETGLAPVASSNGAKRPATQRKAKRKGRR